MRIDPELQKAFRDAFTNPNEGHDITIGRCRLVLTCCACPEQYDVYHGDDQIGYLRLRWGCFRADHRGEKVYYSEEPNGDGIFDDDERARFLSEAVAAIEKAEFGD